MRFEKVYIEGLAYHLPDNIVTSAEIEKRLAPLYDRLKLPRGRLELMSGIQERRFWEKGVFPSEVATVAGEKAIARSGVDPDQIGCLISASVCRDFMEPSTASVIHNNLKLSGEAFVFDVSNACLGVLNGMSIIASMIEQNQILAGLVVAGENGGPLVNNTIETMLARKDITRSEIKSSFASLTIGSSAVGVVLAHEKIAKQGHRLVGGISMAETQFNQEGIGHHAGQRVNGPDGQVDATGNNDHSSAYRHDDKKTGICSRLHECIGVQEIIDHLSGNPVDMVAGG